MTLPPVGIWHDHDGSAQCPLPVGTVHDYVYRASGVMHKNCTVLPHEPWNMVARYLVHSYPENHDG